MSKKLFIYILLTILCMTTIFIFSSKDTNESNSTSKGLIYKAVNVCENVFNKDLDEDKIIAKLNYPIRKLAHFSLYFLLGLFIYNIFLLTKIKYKKLLTIIICIVYAITDETHQLFVSGRTGQLLDIFIDSIGSLTSILLLKLIKKEKLLRKESLRDNMLQLEAALADIGELTTIKLAEKHKSIGLEENRKNYK